jgi:hypothetical protein
MTKIINYAYSLDMYNSAIQQQASKSRKEHAIDGMNHSVRGQMINLHNVYLAIKSNR